MKNKNNISELMNYSISSSNTNNYNSSPTSSSPESFPDLINNGFIAEYKSAEFSSEIVKENFKSE